MTRGGTDSSRVNIINCMAADSIQELVIVSLFLACYLASKQGLTGVSTFYLGVLVKKDTTVIRSSDITE
jgi:hypothetical protein